MNVDISIVVDCHSNRFCNSRPRLRSHPFEISIGIKLYQVRIIIIRSSGDGGVSNRDTAVKPTCNVDSVITITLYFKGALIERTCYRPRPLIITIDVVLYQVAIVRITRKCIRSERGIPHRPSNRIIRSTCIYNDIAWKLHA